MEEGRWWEKRTVNRASGDGRLAEERRGYEEQASKQSRWWWEVRAGFPRQRLRQRLRQRPKTEAGALSKATYSTLLVISYSALGQTFSGALSTLAFRFWTPSLESEADTQHSPIVGSQLQRGHEKKNKQDKDTILSISDSRAPITPPPKTGTSTTSLFY